MRIFLCFLSAIFITSCGSTFVDYDYDKKVDFSTYKTYAFDFERVDGFSEFDEKRFTQAVEKVLDAKGLAFSETPDILIAAKSATYETQSRNTLGVGVGGGGGAVGVGVSGGIPIGGRELHRELTVTIYEEQNNSVIWEAQSESDLKIKATPEQRETYFEELVSKIFKKFPPSY